MPNSPSAPTEWHHLSSDETLSRLATDPVHGLPKAEAAERLGQYGPNVVTARGGLPAWLRFLLQFHQPLIYILLAGAGITAFF
ncbi:MAG TPA: cation-transporting P-type ATPase, partial [Bacteroidia bacterium]|nr:cation-transporting P-type ATPase [Bacteroidia bacterium]